MLDLKEGIDYNIVKVGGFNIPLPSTDRSSRQKILQWHGQGWRGRQYANEKIKKRDKRKTAKEIAREKPSSLGKGANKGLLL